MSADGWWLLGDVGNQPNVPIEYKIIRVAIPMHMAKVDMDMRLRGFTYDPDAVLLWVNKGEISQ
jgi:hypothetical protein